VRPALVLGAVARERTQILNAGGEPVAQTLQLAQVEQTWAAGRAALRERRGYVRKAFGHDRRDLRLKPRDLSAQRGPRGALAISGLSATIADQLPGLAHPADSS